MSTPTPPPSSSPSRPSQSRRRSSKRASNPKLGWALGIAGGIFVILLSIGFGVQMQAQHHIISAPIATQTHQ